MADNLRKYTTQEVLNKVYTDSSGNSIGLNAATSKETLNAVLTSGSDSLNVALSGGTISGDVTIAGDLTVQGDGSGTYSEIITGVLQISAGTGLNDAPINLLSRDTAVATTGEGVRLRFGKSNDSFLADFGYRYQSATDKGASISSTDNLRLALAGQDNAQFLLKGGNSTTGSSIDIRTYETTVVADDVLGKITFSAPYEASGTDAILAGAEIKALATAEFTSSVNSTDLIFSTGASEAATEKMRITSAGLVGIGTTSPTATGSSAGILHIENTTTSSTTQGASIRLSSKDGSAATNDGHRLGVIDFAGEEDSSGTLKVGAKIEAFADDHFTAADDYDHAGRLVFSVQSDTTDVDQLAVPAMIINANSRISLSNNDTGVSNTIFGKSAGDSDGAGDQNVYVGESAGGNGVQTDASDNNVGVGFRALQAITQGASNIGVGKDALYSTTTASNNIGIGSNAAQAYTTIGDNIGIGADSLNLISGGSGGNIAIGTQAMKSSGTASNNDAQYNTVIGTNAFKEATDGDSNVAVGYDALRNLTAGSGNVAIGFQSLLDADNNEEHNVAIGQQSMENLNYNGSGNNIAMGLFSMNCGTVAAAITDNIAIGQYTLSGITQGSLNVAIGGNALGAATTATSNVAIGKNAMLDNTTGGYTVAIGREALANINNHSNDGSVVIGYAAGNKQVGTGGQYTTANTLVGRQAGTTITTGALNTAVGFESMGGVYDSTALEGSNNVAVGHKAGRLMEGAAQQNTIIGASAGDATTTESYNTIIGYNAGGAIRTDNSNNNVIIGRNAGVGGAALTTDCVIIGSGAGETGDVGGADNVFIGKNAGAGTWTAASLEQNVAIGTNAMYSGTKNSADKNVAIGYSALTACTTGDENVAMGHQAGDAITSGSYNTIIGRLADGNATANGQLAIGYGTSTSGGYSTRVGYSGSAHTYSTVIGGLGISSEQSHQTVIGEGGMFKFVSKEYTCDHASDDDGDVAHSEGTPIKIPANGVIKSISAILTQLSNLGTYSLAITMSDDSSTPVDDAAPSTNVVELIGADASTSKIGVNGNTADIAASASGGHAVNSAYYNGFDGNGQHVGTADKYIHIVNAGTGNGDTDPSTVAKIKILVEYVGKD